MNVGEAVQLQAVLRYSDGSEAPVTAVWTATPNAVGSVSATGVLTGLKLGHVAVTATMPDRTGVAFFRVMNENGVPARVDLSGTWQGRVLIKDCSRVSGPGSSPCVVGSHLDLAMMLVQDNYSVSSHVTLGSSAVGTLSGWRDYIGNIILTGTLSASDGSDSREITEWNTRVGPPWSEMSGEFEVVRRFGNHFGEQVVRYTYEIVTLTR